MAEAPGAGVSPVAAPNAGVPLSLRALTPRSLMLSLLLGMHPPRLTAARLVRWCELFGVGEGTTRVALSRMVKAGELITADGVYRLTGRQQIRQSTQDFVLRPEFAAWDGAWSVGVVTAERTAAQRVELRSAMRALRFAEQREGVWTRPDNLPRRSAPDDAWAAVDAQCYLWRAQPEGDASALASQMWGLDEWARAARDAAGSLTAATVALGQGVPAIADGFRSGAAALGHLRTDPLLPVALLPPRWPGDDLRRAYREFQPAFAAAVRDWFRST